MRGCERANGRRNAKRIYNCSRGGEERSAEEMKVTDVLIIAAEVFVGMERRAGLKE